MLARAVKYKCTLSDLMVAIADDPYYDDLTGAYAKFNWDIKDDNYNCHQMVSLDNKFNVVGYLEASIDRPGNYISNLMLINFYKNNIRFSIDLKDFIFQLFFRYNYEKIVWNTTSPSRNENIYDKFSSKYGGRVVGIHYKHTVLQNGDKKNIKIYEMFKDEFIARLKLVHPKELKL